MPKGFKSNAELDFLTAVERGEVVTQLALKQRVGVSVGLINALLKRAVNKGYVKVRRAPYRRYAYYLTPKGFSEKSRLVAKYLETSLALFRDARDQYAEIFEQARNLGMGRLVLAGGGELAEIALLAASGEGNSVVAVIDPQANRSGLRGVPIVRSVAEVEAFDGIVLTDSRSPQGTYDQLRQSLPGIRIFLPAILRVVPDRLDLVAAAHPGENDA